MVRFNTLRISPDGCCFYLDVSVDSASYYRERVISEIWIDSDQTFNNSTGPSSDAVQIAVTDGGEKYHVEQIPYTKLLNIIKGTKNLRGHMLYVYVFMDGPVSGNVPCGGDSEMYIGVAVDWNKLYHDGLAYVNQVTKDCCNIPKDFINYILRMKALEMELNTGHFIMAKNTWDKFFAPNKKRAILSNCGCNK